MTLLFMDGFALGTSKWIVDTPGDTIIGTTTPRITNGCYLSSDAGVPIEVNRGFTASDEVFIGFAIRLSSGTTDFAAYIKGDGGATTHLVIRRNVAGFIEVRRGTIAGTVLGTGATAISDDAWWYVEVRATIDDVGLCQVRLNGAGTNEIDYTGDTKNGGTNYTADCLGFSYVDNSRITDVYILNALGILSRFEWLGDVAVRTSRPTGDGTTSQLVGSDADSVDNWALVNEDPLSSAEYVGSATLGEKDTYTMADLPAGITAIYGVAWNGFVAKSDAGAISAAPVIRFGGIDYVGDSLTLPTDYAIQQVIYEVEPLEDSGWWTLAGVNNLEAGIQVAS